MGRAVTYAATSPSLCALERLVQIGAADLAPLGLVMLRFDLPDDVPTVEIDPADLPTDWRDDIAETRSRGDALLTAQGPVIAIVPSVLMGFAGSPDRNALINHRAAGSASITIGARHAYAYDPRLSRSSN